MNVTERYTKADAVRYALMTVGDPENADFKRVIAIAQAKMDQMGLKLKITGKDVSNVRVRLHQRASGGKITKALVCIWVEEIARARGSVPSPSSPTVVKSVAQTTPPVVTSKPELTIKMVTCASEFAKSCGGIETALAALAKLKEFVS